VKTEKEEENIIYSKFDRARREMWHMYTYCNEVYTALIENKQDQVEVDVSAQGCYNDWSIPLQVVMQLSLRGFDSEYVSKLVPLKHDDNGAIIRCHIESFLRVTKSTRTPSITPVFCKLPEHTNSGIFELEYATAFVQAVENWLNGIE
jgi:hypothetical protein